MNTQKTFLVLVNFSPAWGGGEQWFLSVAEGLMNKGHKVLLWTRPQSILAKRAQDRQIPLLELKANTLSLINPIKLFRAVSALKKANAGAIMFNASHELKFGGIAAKFAGIPNIIFRRGLSFALTPSIANRWYFKYIANAFLANSQATFDAFSSSFPNIKHISNLTAYNGIDMKKWPLIDSENSSNTICISARLSKEKGIERAIQGVQLLKEKGLNPQLNILGEGPEKENLEALVGKMNLEKNIKFKGFVEDVRKELVQSGIFLFTPHHGEGTSIALIEAMACNLPCIAFDTPSMNEVIIHGKTGFLIPDGDIQQMTDRLAQLIENPTLKKEMGITARRRAEAYFSLERLVDKVEDFIFSLSHRPR